MSDEPQSEPSPTEIALEEIRRQKRVVNQMTSMHSILRGRYRFWSRLVTVVLLTLSVAGAAMGFAAGTDRVGVLGITALRTTWLGWFAVAVIVAVLVDQVFDLRGRSVNHADAVRQLATLLAEYRAPIPEGQEVTEHKRLGRLYQFVMDGLPDIPDRQFNRLKATHLKKVEVSRFLSAHPGMSERQARRAISKRLKG